MCTIKSFHKYKGLIKKKVQILDNVPSKKNQLLLKF